VRVDAKLDRRRALGWKRRCSSSLERASDGFSDLSSSERRTCYQLLWATGGLISFVERWWIKLGGGRLPEIRTAAVGQAHVPEHVRRPLLLPRCGARTNGACPASANPLICGANRTIITGCTHKPRAPPSSCNKCPRKRSSLLPSATTNCFENNCTCSAHKIFP